MTTQTLTEIITTLYEAKAAAELRGDHAEHNRLTSLIGTIKLERMDTCQHINYTDNLTGAICDDCGDDLSDHFCDQCGRTDGGCAYCKID